MATGYSRVPPSIHEAERNIRILRVSCRSAMNFAREPLLAEPEENREASDAARWQRRTPTTECLDEGSEPGSPSTAVALSKIPAP
jgi:hypothetical protein